MKLSVRGLNETRMNMRRINQIDCLAEIVSNFVLKSTHGSSTKLAKKWNKS